jgi:hypothetical protein
VREGFPLEATTLFIGFAARAGGETCFDPAAREARRMNGVVESPGSGHAQPSRFAGWRLGESCSNSRIF